MVNDAPYYGSYGGGMETAMLLVRPAAQHHVLPVAPPRPQRQLVTCRPTASTRGVEYTGTTSLQFALAGKRHRVRDGHCHPLPDGHDAGAELFPLRGGRWYVFPVRRPGPENDPCLEHHAFGHRELVELRCARHPGRPPIHSASRST